MTNWPEAGQETQWFGALHYMELVDCTEEGEKAMHSVFSPCVPRVGEVIEPEKGSLMEVVQVRHIVSSQKDSAGAPHVILVPYVFLEAVESEDESAEDSDS